MFARLITALALLLGLTALTACGREPFRAGHTEDSPDGKYAASAMFVDATKERLVYEIHDKASGTLVWKLDTGPRKATDPPFDQGFGRFEFIQWSADSREVRFAYECDPLNITTVTQWLAVTLNSAGKIAGAPVKTNIGLRPEEKARQTPTPPPATKP